MRETLTVTIDSSDILTGYLSVSNLWHCVKNFIKILTEYLRAPCGVGYGSHVSSVENHRSLTHYPECSPGRGAS